MSMPANVLVTGASGKTGRRIVHQLRAKRHAVIAASRSMQGHQDVQFDWLDATTYDAVLTKRIDSAYLVAPADIFDVLPAMKPFIDRLLSENVKRIVLLSASPLEKGGPMMGTVHAYLAEHAPSWVVLRPTWFMQNFSEQHHAQSIRNENAIYSATQDGKVAFISADDIAAVAAVALTDPTVPNGDYILTGPEALSYDEVVHLISDTTGRTITYHRLSMTALAKRYEQQGLPPEYAQTLAAMDVNIANGSEAQITSNVQKITGTRPIDFGSFAKDVVDAWSAT